MCGNKRTEIFGWCAIEGDRCGEETIQPDADCSERVEEEFGWRKSDS